LTPQKKKSKLKKQMVAGKQAADMNTSSNIILSKKGDNSDEKLTDEEMRNIIKDEMASIVQRKVSTG
jgi:hypothetical protein